ncbi:MAG: CHAT domain-containing protein [Saprospiraceae bacterium]|nr:CHAT domain-containing protein [Saprospiraceae bacterium]
MWRFALLSGLALIFWLTTSQAPAGDRGALLLQEARALLDSARYEAALQRGQEALEHFPARDTSAGACLLLLGHVFLETGQWEAAREQYQAALDIFTQQQGPDGLLAAQALNALGEYFYKKNDSRQAEQYYRRAMDIREARLGGWHEWVADGYNNIGNCRVLVADYAGATELHEKALYIRYQILPLGHPDQATSLNNLGNCAYLSGDFEKARIHFKQALVYREERFGPKHPKTAQVLNNLGNACAALGQRSQAIELYRRALDIRRQAFGPQHPGVASALENIADLYADNGDFIAALDYYRQAYSIQRGLQGEQSVAAATLWHKIGLCYQYEGDTRRALAQHLAAEPVLRAAFGNAHPFLAGLYNNIGNCLARQNDPAPAQAYYEKALAVFRNIRPLPYAGLALSYNNLGMLQHSQGRYLAAVANFDKALATVAAGQPERTADYAIFLKNKGLTLQQLGRWPETQAVFAEAQRIADTCRDELANTEIRAAWGSLLCQRGLHLRDTTLLRQSLTTLEAALLASDSLRLQLSAPASRQRWLERQFPSLNSALEACFELWTLTREPGLPERAFALAERGKSLQLLEQLRKEQAGRFAGVPDSLLQQERYWQEELNRLDKQRLAWLAAGKTEQAALSEAAVAQARQALAELIRRFEQDYPAYFRHKYERPTATWASLRQHLLSPDQALLEYCSTDTAVFVFVLTATEFRWLRLPLDFPLTDWVASLRHSLQAYPEASGSAATELSATYCDRAYRLYEKLVAPVVAAVDLPPGLLIAPDGALAYLPFECLLREQAAAAEQFKSHRYLVRDFRISYAYSATQQLELLLRPARRLPHTLLAVAPAYENNPYGLQALQHNRPEVQAVSQLFGGKVLEGAAASSGAFLAAAGQYRLLLLATHGQASSAVGELSYLAFSATADSTENPFLYVRDLYTQSIPAELVVLSACETSVGEYQLGQGVISLAKGFFQAGARSVVATLWSVDDARNAELVQLFFQQLRAGAAKDAALQHAKLDFLQNHPHDEAHPVYWAALTGYGDMRALENQAWGGWFWLGLAVVGSVAGYLFWRSNRR